MKIWQKFDDRKKAWIIKNDKNRIIKVKVKQPTVPFKGVKKGRK